MASFGSCALALPGTTFPSATHLPNLPPALPTMGGGGVLSRILEALAKDLKERGELDLSECFIDGTFVVAKRGLHVGKTKRGKGTKLMAVADGTGLPLAVHAANAQARTRSPSSAKTLASSFLDARPQRLIGDRAYDSTRSTPSCEKEGVEMVAPHRRSAKNPRPRTGASSGATRGAGRSSDRSRG